MKRVMIWLVKLYRKYISPLKRPCCRFTPTCSQYAIEAFEKRGFFVGFYLTVWRILRCNPFSKGGYDPVPERRCKRDTTSLSHSSAENTNFVTVLDREDNCAQSSAQTEGSINDSDMDISTADEKSRLP